jgi:sugar phosphate permease
LAFVLGGIPGPILGGYLTDFLVKLNPKWRAWLPALATLLCLPIYYLCLMSTRFWWFLVIFSCGYLTFLVAQPPTLSLLQLAVKPDQRAMAVAVAMLFNNLIGQALGGFLIGLTSTSLSATQGPMALSYAVLFVSVGFGIPAAFLYVWTAKAIKADFETR